MQERVSGKPRGHCNSNGVDRPVGHKNTAWASTYMCAKQRSRAKNPWINFNNIFSDGSF